jgi:hypothetical protein
MRKDGKVCQEIRKREENEFLFYEFLIKFPCLSPIPSIPLIPSKIPPACASRKFRFLISLISSK